MIGLAAFASLAQGIGALLELVVFEVLRLHDRRDAMILGALWLYLGSVLGAGCNSVHDARAQWLSPRAKPHAEATCCL